MKLHTCIKILTVILLLGGAILRSPGCSAYGLIAFLMALALQGNDMENRLNVLEGNKNETKQKA